MQSETIHWPDLLGPVRAYKVRQYRNSPCTSNRASSLGGDCERELVYARTRWQDASPPPDDLIVIFQEGEKHEIAVLNDLRAAGIEVYEQQTSLEWREYQITGHIDATVRDGKQETPVPVDVKSMSPHIWDSVFFDGAAIYAWGQVADRFESKPWLRKYRAQITLYCLMRDCERGILLCINKGTGALAQVNVPLDYAYGESLVQRAERINRHVEKGTLPERIPFSDDVCPRCPFYALCLPDQVGRNPIAFISESEIENLLGIRERVQEFAAEYRAVDTRIKAWAKEQPWETAIVGPCLLKKKTQRNGTRVEISTSLRGAEVIP